jgi:hypothetical protein
MGRRPSIVVGVVIAAVIGGIGWAASPHALPRPGPPYTADFGVPHVDRATGRVVASGTLTNLLPSPLRFEVHLECNPHTQHIEGFALHSRLLVAVPHASQPWTAWSAVLRTVSRPGRSSASDRAHLDAYVTCAYWFATPGVPQ